MFHSNHRLQYLSIMAVTTLIFLFILLMQSCGDDDVYRGDFKTEYQGIFLANGAGYFGKIEKMGNNFIILSDVYYIENQKSGDTTKTVIIKRGNEIHRPDIMYINVAHILMIEPVAKDSNIAQSINAIRMHQ